MRGGRVARITLSIVLVVSFIAVAAVWVFRVGPFDGQADDEQSIGVIDGDFVLLGPGSTDAKVDSKDGARAVISELGHYFGIEDAATQLADPDVQQGLDNTYYRFGQRYENVPVYGRSVVVGSGPEGNVLGVTGNYLPLEGLNVEPTVSLEDAAKVACGDAQDAGAMSRGLCIYAPDGATPVLTWAYEVISPGSSELVFVDADAGTEVARESQAMSANGSISATNAAGEDIVLNVEDSGDGAYVLKDNERNIWGYDANREIVDFEYVGGIDEHGNLYSLVRQGKSYYFVSASGEVLDDDVCSDGHHYVLYNGAGSIVAEHARFNLVRFMIGNQSLSPMEGNHALFLSADASSALTLQGYLSDATDFYQELFGRDGFDGEGGRVFGVADTWLINDKGKNDTVNAYTYSETGYAVIQYGCDLELSYDVVTHEMTHALEQSISGMLGEGEAGALKEAVSDLLAMTAEDYAADGRFDGAGCNWAMSDMRNLADPLKGINGKPSGPAVYGGTLWDADNDVHYNSTIISHAGYLMCMGDNLEGETLSTERMAQLVYLTLFSLPPDCTFSQFRAAMENVASSMVAIGRLTVQQAARVSAAFDAVNVTALQALTEISPDASLQVLDRNNAKYGNYEVTVCELWSVYVAAGPGLEMEISSENKTWDLRPEGTKPLSLGFSSEGLYCIEVRDDANTLQAMQLYVMVAKDATHGNPLVLHTTFGEFSSDSSQTRRAYELPDKRAHDIALVLDVSGSMSGEPIEQMKNAAEEFVESTLDESTREGLIAYDNSAEVLQGLSDNADDLTHSVEELHSGGDTNIEDGLVKARQMLSSGVGTRKIIVLMSDGEPNQGKTGDELIAYANGLKENGYKIYTVGFNEGADGYALLYEIASEGCHYEIESADDLSDFFADIASEINGTLYVYVRVECPVDVEVGFEGETLASAEESRNQRAAFGTLTFEDEVDAEGNVVEKDGTKVLRLREGPAYDVEIRGTGDGEMDYSIGFADGAGDYNDFRTFESIAITPSTIVHTGAGYDDTTRLTVDEDGDGVIDLAYEAGSGQSALPVDNHTIIYYTLAGCAVVTVSLGVAVYGFWSWGKQHAA